MNQEQAKKWLPLIQALADGKALQCKTLSGGWANCLGGDMTIVTFKSPENIRIKPEPKKEWVRVALLKSGPGHRAFAYNEWSEVNIETDIFFGGWLTERIEYELPELNDSLAFSTNMPQSKIGVDK